jgi:hypothetical protein
MRELRRPPAKAGGIKMKFQVNWISAYDSENDRRQRVRDF